MNSSSTQLPTSDGPGSSPVESTTGDGQDTDRPRLNAARKALLWVVLVVFAFGPFPWW
jgi:hypothetical protein